MRPSPRLTALLGGLTLLLVFLVALNSVTRFDFWWYLRSGQYIVETRSVPAGDPFSFTAAGRPWINHMWLTQVLLYLGWERLGRVPILVVKSLLVTATFGVVLATALRRGAHPLLAVGVTALAAVAGQASWHVRPQVVTYLLVAVYLYLLREGWERRRRSLVGIPLLMVPWANLHAGFVTGLGLLGLVAIGEALGWLIERDAAGWRRLRILGGLVLASGLAALVNPFGLRALLFPLEVVSSRAFMTTTVEWFSPNFHDPQHRPFEALLLLLFAALGLAGPRLRPTDVVLAVAFTHLGLLSVRHIPLFAVVVTPILADALGIAAARVWASRGARLVAALGRLEAALPSLAPLARVPAVHAAAAAVVLGALTAGYGVLAFDPLGGPLRQDLNEAAYPRRTAEFMRRERVPGPLFNVYVWAGYELWALYPEYRVFFDGRTHVYGAGIVRDYLEVTAVRRGWTAVLDRWGIQSILTPTESPLAEALFASSGWRLVFVDREAVLFVRNVPGHQALFDRVGPVARPVPRARVQAALTAALAEAEGGRAEAAIHRLRRVLALDRDNPVALYSLGVLLARQGDRAAAEYYVRALERAAPGSGLAGRVQRALEGAR